MWGQGPPVVVGDSPPREEETQAVVTGGDAPVTEEMLDLEEEMRDALGGMLDAFSVNLPFTVEDKKRIAKNLNTISEEYEGEELHFTRAVLLYMLKELHDVFGNQDAFKSEIEKLVENKLEFEAEKLEAAIETTRRLKEKRAEEANAGEEGLAGRKRKRFEPATATGSQVSTK